MAVSEREAALTLIEVVIASSLLLLTAVCATPLLVDSLAAGSHGSRADEAALAAESQLEWLRSLPFAPPAPTSPAAVPAPSVLGEVFPHADPARNAADAYVVLTGGGRWPPGTFVKTHPLPQGLAMTTACRFAAGAGEGLSPLAPACLIGYDAVGGTWAPSGALLATVVVSWTDHGHERRVVRQGTLLDEADHENEESP